MSENLDKAQLRDMLIKRREQALENIASSKETAAPVELDQARQGRLSRMDAMQQQAMSQARLERAQLELSQIDATLQRLETEDFGYCTQCGNDIELARLQVNPTFLTCKKCM